MASYPVNVSTHRTLTASTVDTVTVNSTAASVIEIKNRGTTDPIYFTKDGTTPAVGADDTYIVLAGESVFVSSLGTPDTIKLIAISAVAYSVTGDQ